MKKNHYDIIIVGGGAAGFFTAINIAEKNPNKKICILEGGKNVLTKVRISGGGRCNVTHAQFDPKELIKNYPRGHKELLGPFYQFGPQDTAEWFADHGVQLNAESDGRMFPISNSSETIIDCFLSASEKLGIDLKKEQNVLDIKKDDDKWMIILKDKNYTAEKLVLTTGSNPKIWEIVKNLGHTIIDPVPSLFTFNISDNRIHGLQGLSANVSLQIQDTKLKSQGPLLITHWGMSGPAILKLSSWGARILYEKDYRFSLLINWLDEMTSENTENILWEIKEKDPRKIVSKNPVFPLPGRLWESLVLTSKIGPEKKWADVTKSEIQNLKEQLTASKFKVTGKSIFKDEFATAGGIDLKEVNCKTMESKLHSNLFFAGEILNIDGVTGGFNFQNAWTGGWIVSESITHSSSSHPILKTLE